MASSEKRKSRSVQQPSRDPAGSGTKEQFLTRQQASEQPTPSYLSGTGLRTPQRLSEEAENEISSFTSVPAHLGGDRIFAFYPSAGDLSESPRPTLADAVIEHLRQARLRRQRPH
jgi:hypothetical protein